MLSGHHTLPCLTTQARDDSGRSAPASSHPSADARRRWEEGHRQFGPWFYEPKNMLKAPNGELHLLTPEVKEQLHQLPPGYAATAGNTRTRNIMLGNGWHLGAAKTMLTWVLTAAAIIQPASSLVLPRQ